VALAYGVIFSTVITLVLVPSSYLILEDIQIAFRWLMGTDGADSDVVAGQGPVGVLAMPAADGGLHSRGAESAVRSGQNGGQQATAQSMESRTRLLGEEQPAGDSSESGD